MKLWLTALAAASLLGIGSAAAVSPQAGATIIQAQYYDPYYNPYYYRYPGYYGYYRRCYEDLGYGRRGNWGCG